MRWLWLIILASWLLYGCSKISTEPNLQLILAGKPAKTLSAYGLMQKGESGFTPVQSVHAYDLINPLFTDYAAKQRYVFVPKDGKAQYNNGDVLTFPVGSVLIKNFGYGPDMRAPDKGAYLVETRLLIRKTTGWAAYPYVWNAEQSEAVYAPVGKKINVGTISPNGEAVDFTYAVPNVNQCKTCHQSGHDIIPIGPKPRNLKHKDQLKNWAGLGILEPLKQEILPVAKVFDPAFSLDRQARAYLDVNCAHCHKADGSASNSGLWLNYGETTPVRLGIKKHPTAAGRGAGGFIYVIDPGAPKNSILPFRMDSIEAGIAMPELGRSLIHMEGVALINHWIAEMPEINSEN